MSTTTLELVFRLLIVTALFVTASGFYVIGSNSSDLQAQVDSLKLHTEDLENTCCYAVEEWSE